MPTQSVPKKSQAKQIQELLSRVAQQDRLLAEQEGLIAKLRDAEEEKENRIPVPDGQAGRGDGYKLFDEMRISKSTFHAIRTLIRHKTSQYLDVTKSLRQQDKTRLRKARTQISNSLPFVRKYYHASWPIHPIMKQYLSSSSKAHKKAKAHLKDITEAPAPLKEQPADTGCGNETLTGAKKPEELPMANVADSDSEVNDKGEDQSDDSDSERSEGDDSDWKRELELVEEAAEEDQSKYEEKRALPLTQQNGKRSTGVRASTNVPTHPKRPKTNVRETTAATVTEKENTFERTQQNGKRSGISASTNVATHSKRPKTNVRETTVATVTEKENTFKGTKTHHPVQRVSNQQNTPKHFATLITQPHYPRITEGSTAITDGSNKHVVFKPFNTQVDSPNQHVTTVQIAECSTTKANTQVKPPNPHITTQMTESSTTITSPNKPCNTQFDPRNQHVATQTVDKGKYPVNCPNIEFCEDPFPTNPGERIKDLYQQYQDIRRNPELLKHKNTGEPKGLAFALEQLCLAIANDTNFRNAGHNWPIGIDFAQLHKRVLELNQNGELWSLVANGIVLHETVAWQFLLGEVSGKTTFQKWVHLPSLEKFESAGGNSAGYYGPAGARIIHTTLQHLIYSPYVEASSTLSKTMAEILETHGDTHFPTTDFWKYTLPVTLTLLDFIFYVACPHVINTLISQDLMVTEAEANKIRLESARHGLHFHETDDEIEEQAVRIMRIAISCPDNPGDSNNAEKGVTNGQPHQGVGMPIRFARKQFQTCTPPAQKRSHDDSENGDEVLRPAQPTKKRRRGPAPRPIGPGVEKLRRSSRLKELPL